MTGALEKFINPVVRSMPPSGIRRFFDLVASTPGVISLGVGEPDFVTPWHIRNSSIESLKAGYTMYTSNWGLPELRRSIAGYLEKNCGLAYDPGSEILVTVGASEAIDLALRTITSPGDEILVPEPCYVSYKPCIALAGGTPVAAPTRQEDDFRPKLEVLECYITPRTKALVLSFPNNPTGAILTMAELQGIAELANRHDLLVISDEIYAELTYNGKHVSIASLPEMQGRTILASGFSKAYAMTGWRVGYLVAPGDLIEAMVKIHQYTILCAPVMAQLAALEALRGGANDVGMMVKQYDQRRRLMFTRLREVGLDCFEPKGAFYIFPSIQETGLSSEEFAEKLLAEERVAVVPGNVFGACGEGYVRCSYATSVAQLTEALDRIERFVRRYQQR